MTDLPESDYRRRAEAAEKTVAVLKRKVVELYNGDQSMIHRQLEATRRREDENRRKRELAELKSKELARYNEILESEVKRRTDAIKTILDNVTFGFLVVGRDLIVRPEVTRSCGMLFETTDVQERYLADLLRLCGRDREQLHLSCDQVFEDILPEEVSLAQLRQKFPQPSGKILKAEGSVIRDEHNEVKAMLFTISDITALESATRENHNNRTLVGILRQKEAFQIFLTETMAQLQHAKHAYDAGDNLLVRRVVHTIKGNAASYGLLDVVDLTHSIEENSHIQKSDLNEIADSLRVFLAKNFGVLEMDLDRLHEHAFAVTAEQLQQFRSILAEMSDKSDNATQLLRSWSAQVLTKPAHQILGPVEDFTHRLAERLGKEVDIHIEGADLPVDVTTMRPVLSSLTHLIRNAVDHGIEPPYARGHKPKRGQVRIQLTDDGVQYRIVVKDDGQGINLPAIRHQALARGYIDENSAGSLSDGGVNLIFLDGVSTAEITTHISGRGVGMSAVQSAVRAAGGNVSVETSQGAGTSFVLVIPKPKQSQSGDQR